MTIKEFTDKYHVPYNIAYKASYVVKPAETFRNDKEYDEQELLAETLSYVKSRLKILKYQYTQYRDAYENLRKL